MNQAFPLDRSSRPRPRVLQRHSQSLTASQKVFAHNVCSEPTQPMVPHALLPRVR